MDSACTVYPDFDGLLPLGGKAGCRKLDFLLRRTLSSRPLPPPLHVPALRSVEYQKAGNVEVCPPNDDGLLPSLSPPFAAT